jgi:hypothetical protein
MRRSSARPYLRWRPFVREGIKMNEGGRVRELGTLHLVAIQRTARLQ